MRKLNPAWVNYNNVQNEGHTDSYNPFPKWIELAPAASPATVASPAAKVYRDSRGMQIDPVALIAAEEARLATVTDAFARELIENSIARYRKMLEG